MKRFLQLTLIIALAVGAVSCKKDEIINTVKEAPKDTPTVKELPPMQKITLSASSTKPGLRIAYDASRGTDVTDDNTLWQEGDEIAVYNVGVSGKPKRFVLVDGAGTSYGTFVGNIEPTGNYYGVYPYSAVRDQVLDGSSISFILPANQSYAEGSFGRDAAVFAATSTTEGDDVVLHFEPLLGYLSLSLKTPSNTTRDASSIVGGHSVGSIVLHENSLGGVALSGKATIDMSSADYEHNIPPTLSAAPGGSLDVTLNCGVVQLGSTPKEFIIAVPAGAFSKGLCATVNGTDGKKIMSLATTASNTITANYITQLPAQDVYNIEDVEGRRYPVAKIGSQFLMAENLQCLTYEEGIGDGITITSSTAESKTDNNPHYFYQSGYGYLYNFAAAMGLPITDEHSDIPGDYPGKGQGICPNGWHVPQVGELYGGLEAYVEENGARDRSISGSWMRTVSGWTDDGGSDFLQGTDDFGFSALPAGYGSKSNVTVGWAACFITTTLYDASSLYSLKLHSVDVGYGDRFSFEWWDLSIQSCAAVRCLKN